MHTLKGQTQTTSVSAGTSDLPLPAWYPVLLQLRGSVEKLWLFIYVSQEDRSLRQTNNESLSIYFLFIPRRNDPR